MPVHKINDGDRLERSPCRYETGRAWCITTSGRTRNKYAGKGTFLAQSYTLLLFTVPIGILTALLGLIPVIGGVGKIFNFYILLLSVRMIMGVHRLSGGKAPAVVLIPLGVIIFIAIFIVIIARPA